MSRSLFHERKVRLMKAVVSVIGKDAVGIIAKVSAECARCGVNILDISQTVLQDYFTMIMITDIDGITVPFPDFVDAMTRIGSANCLPLHWLWAAITRCLPTVQD